MGFMLIQQNDTIGAVATFILFHVVFDGFLNTTVRNVSVGTVQGGTVALECDFAASNPPPEVLWFANDVMVEEVTSGNRILFLEGGRYLFIQRLTAAQQMMRYHCVVNNFRDENTMPMRAPTTYTLTANLAAVEISVYKDLGSMVGAVGEPLEFVFAAAAANEDGAVITFSPGCTPNDLVTLTFTDNMVNATLTEAARNEDRVDFTCSLVAIGRIPPGDTDTHILRGSITVSSKFMLCSL